MPAKLRFWDLDNDGNAEAFESHPELGDAGLEWGPGKLDRFDEAANRWRTETHFNPEHVPPGATTHHIYVSGIDPYSSCLPGGWDQNPGILAVACPMFVDRGTYEDLYDVDIFFNADGFDWYYSTGDYDASNPKYSFRGILTHELGHAIRLKDIPADQCGTTKDAFETMCGSFTAQRSFWAYSLNGDDVRAADSVYPGA